MVIQAMPVCTSQLHTTAVEAQLKPRSQHALDLRQYYSDSLQNPSLANRLANTTSVSKLNDNLTAPSA